jgi:hypothetical protein
MFGTLISEECRFGTMFISPAPVQRLCFKRIIFVASIFVLSGSMNTFLDGRPVSWNNSISISAPAPEVQPVSKMPVLLAIFLFHFSAILFITVVFDVSVVMDSK